jgi:hypothetical protein
VIAVADLKPLEALGYPPVVILAVLGIGVPLLLFRPYGGFLFAVLLLTAGHFHMFNKTRPIGLGPYLNLNDVCVLLALMACYVDRVAGRKPVRIPQIVALMLSVVVIAGAQSAWVFGWTHTTQGLLRGALDFPIAFLLAANLVDSTERARKLLWTLVAAVVLAAGQHVLFVAHTWATKSLSLETYAAMRTIGYWAGCLPSAFLLTAVVWPAPRSPVLKVLRLAAGVLLLATIFLNQTRSLWLATLATVPLLMLALRRTNWLAVSARLAVSGVVIVLALGFLCQRLIPGLDIGVVMKGRLTSVLERDPRLSGMGTRQRAFGVEMASWMQGTMLFGRGLGFFQGIENPEDGAHEVAFAHLGYVTYLSQLGVVGFLVYGVLLPLLVLRNGLTLWKYGREPVLRFLGGLGTASIISMSIMFVMSSHLLGFTYFSTGVLYGALWALVRHGQLDAPCRDWCEAESALVPVCAPAEV